jgi:hypothetical protein
MNRDETANSSLGGVKMKTVLKRLGLEQYEESLVENGFQTWETVTQISESDMSEMGFKLGHRRKLQRAITNEKNRRSTNEPLCFAANLPSSRRGLPVIGQHSTEDQTPPVLIAPTKRQYRRRPQADGNAPRKPKTAYVLFGEHVRRDPEVSFLSFAEIAKEVGKRWASLSRDERVNTWEKPAVDRMERYSVELEEYKKTKNYHSYQIYLEDFKRGQQKKESGSLLNETTLPATTSTASTTSLASRSRETSQTTHWNELSPAKRSSAKPHTSHTTPPILTSSFELGMEEVGKVLQTHGVNLHYFGHDILPSEEMTNVAVEAFLHGTGALLSLWNHDEALDLVKSVYHPTGASSQVDTAEVLAMAAIGSYCDSEAISSFIPENFFHSFLSMLVVPENMTNLRRMRLFVCLAICRFTDSVESARALICKFLNLA